MRLVVTGFTGPYTLPDDIEHTHRPHRPRVRRLGQRAELLDAQVRARESSEAPAHVRLLEQDLGRHHLPRRAGRAGAPAPRAADGGPHADARRAAARGATTCGAAASTPSCSARPSPIRRRASSTPAAPPSGPSTVGRQGKGRRAGAALPRGRARRPDRDRRAEERIKHESYG